MDYKEAEIVELYFLALLAMNPYGIYHYLTALSVILLDIPGKTIVISNPEKRP